MANPALPFSMANRPTSKDVLGWVGRGEVGLALGVVGIRAASAAGYCGAVLPATSCSNPAITNSRLNSN